MGARDFFNRLIREGDRVVFVTHSSTSSNFNAGTVIKVNPKTVEIETERGSKTRKEGYKVIVMSKISADVAPVVHGAWEEHCEEDGFVHHRCSKCKKNAFYEYKTIPLYEEDNDGEIVDCGVMQLDIIEQLTSFCPHCGAKMDEEEKHG